jgi:hypothetical protein
MSGENCLNTGFEVSKGCPSNNWVKPQRERRSSNEIESEIALVAVATVKTIANHTPTKENQNRSESYDR